MSTPAGWYPDPHDPSVQRWWDGTAWGQHTQATLPSVPAPGALEAQVDTQPQFGIQPAYVQPTVDASAGGYSGVPAATALATRPVVSPWGRFGAYLLELFLAIITLGLGWLVWAATLADKGQTPAKKMLGHRVIMDYTGEPASFPRMLFLRGLIAGFVTNWAVVFTVGIILLMPFWDSKNRNLWDHLSSTRVVYDASS